MMISWQLYPTVSGPMPFQMAIDEILFKDCIDRHTQGLLVQPLLRFYYSSEPWISLGYAYSGWKNLEEGIFPPENGKGLPAGVPVCRRLTGGGQVLHGRDLMFTVIAPKNLDESFRSVRVSYWKLHDVLKKALESMGKKPEFYRCDENLPQGKDCFLFPIATDLRIGSKKIAGGGQKRSSGILLHQESVLLRSETGYERLIPALKQCFTRELGAEFFLADLDPDLLFRAEKLGTERYEVVRPLKAGEPSAKT